MRLILSIFGSLALGLVSSLSTVRACTIFVLKDASRTLFFNNEDFSNPHTRIWFLPATNECFGSAFVGFDDGWPQGGVNSEGLAFDWVAGFNDKWKAARGMKKVRGSSSQRMLESCSTVPQAIEFYRTHLEPSFARSRILIADGSGTSVIIGYKEGKLNVEESQQCRGFGYGGDTVRKELIKAPEPTVANGLSILRACRQQGEFATKYSNVFDLRSGDIFLFPADNDSETKLNLAAELQKGPHFYDLPEIRQQIAEAPKALLNDMNPNFMEEYNPIPDKEPEVTVHVQKIMEATTRGQLRSGDFTPELWKEVGPTQKQAQADLKKLGRLEKVTLVERVEQQDKRIYRYRLDYKNAAVLQIFAFDNEDRVAFTDSEGTQWK